MNKSIVISNLRKNFKGKIALQDINLSINSGEIFGFLGPSGAGKTTTINILTGQLSPDEGTVKILGEDCTQLTSDKFLELGIMSDNVGFYDRLSLYDNLIFFAKFHNVEISYLDSLLKRLKLYDDRFKKAEKLSTGMKQRMLLIRAILHSPQLIFLDEPTSALDLNNAVEFMKILKNISMKKEISVIIIIHDLNLASLFCDSLIILKDGKFIKKGSPKEVINEENIKSVYNLECKVCYNENDKPYIIPIT